MTMVAAGFSSKSHPSSASTRETSLTRKLAAVAGTAGAAVIGASEAQAVVYTPTAGVAAAQGIPGFTFVDASNVTLGALYPPTNGQVSWDVDGTGGNDFRLLRNFYSNPHFGFRTRSANLSAYGGGGRSFFFNGAQLANLAAGSPVNAGGGWFYNIQVTAYTQKAADVSSAFQANTPGQFGFRFTNASATYYGWGSLTLDLNPTGQGFVITEAYYNTTPGGAINVGAVPQAVPEPSSMALLGLGAAGVAAWRSRRKATAEVEA